jgi:hypothetical protein
MTHANDKLEKKDIMNELLVEYTEKITPILPLAKKAYGSRNQNSPEHTASRTYTELLVEYQEKGGSLPQLAVALKVAYPGLRRRVVMKDVSVSSIKPKTRATKQQNLDAAQRVKEAKEIGIDQYHDQLADEYRSGVSLSILARELGLSSAAPLYYGVQSSLKRNS